jgi:hypothetical protein
MADALLIKTLVVIVASVCAISLVARIRPPAAADYLLPAVLAWMIACLPGKALVVILVGAIMRWPPPVGARAALILARGGEAGFTAGHPGDESGRNRTERWAACPTGRSREANWAQAQPATFV